MKTLLLLSLLFCLLTDSFGQSSGRAATDSARRDTTRFGKDTQQLREVIIRGQKPLYQQQIYGTVINVESSVLTKGSSALEVLERSPGVIIDHHNNSISLNGKSGVTVMLNGRLLHLAMEQVVTLLNSMSADDIEKIELLTTPPSKYDAEGSAGMINIVLRKNKRLGTNGSFSLTGGYGWREKGTASLNLARNTKKFDFYGSYTFSHDKTYSDLLVEGYQDFPLMGGPLDIVFMDTTFALHNNHDAALGLDARLSQKTTIGGSVSLNSSKGSYHSLNRGEYNVLPDSLLLLDAAISTVSRWHNLGTSVYLERKIKEGEKINIDMDYLRYANNSPSAVQSSFVDKNGNKAGTNNDSVFSPVQKGFANTTIQVGVAKMDYTRQIGKKIKLETGAKGTYTRSSSLSGIETLVNGAFINRNETSNAIVMKENIGAVYASINAQLNPSTNLVIAARYEYDHAYTVPVTGGDGVNPATGGAGTNPGTGGAGMDPAATGAGRIDRKSGVLFPGIFLSRKLSERAELQLSYTKRITRPSYNDLASFIAYSDPESVITGNPLLLATITNNLKAGYSYKGYSFSVLLSRDDHPIARYQLTKSPTGDLMYVSPQNLDYQNNLTFQANAPWQVNNWWDMSYSFTGGWRQFKESYTSQPAEKTYFSYSVNFTETFKLPKNYSAELAGWYYAPSYGGTVRNDGAASLNAGIKKELKNDGGTLQLSVTDLLRTQRFTSHFGALTEEAFAVKNKVTYDAESHRSPIIKLTYTRSFGAGTAKTRREDNGARDEKDRVRKE